LKPEISVQEDVLYRGKVLTFNLQKARLLDGSLVDRTIIRTPGAVVVVPVSKDNEVRFVRQYRAAAARWVLELPAGGLNPGETPEVAAPRELLEETGDQAATWISLGGFYTAPGILDEYLHLFLAKDLTPGPNQLESDEHIEVVTLPWSEVIGRVSQGQIEDAKTISGLFQAGLYLNLPFG
jgi:ADP-ribose pyrophosphatase